MNTTFVRRSILAACAAAAPVAGSALAAPIAAPGFSVTTFATAPAGSSAPDSVAVAGGNVYVGYGNGGDPTGANGATSTIAEYSASGALINTTTVTGHNDGLRYNAATNTLWAIQNEDANANLVLITPGTLAKSSPYSFSAATHGGGYDDAAFLGGNAYISASNPSGDPNTAPALVSATLGAGVVNVSGVLNGNATAKVINDGSTTTLNLQDPDSLTTGPGGQLVLDSQADKQLVFVSNPGLASQSASVLNVSNQLDDTAFANSGSQSLLVAAKGDNAIYEITGNFTAGGAYSAAASGTGVPNTDFVGQVNLANGNLTPILSGLAGPAGEAFLSAEVPEPASLALLGAGMASLAAFRRRRNAV